LEAGVSNQEKVSFAKLPSHGGRSGRIVVACFVKNKTDPVCIAKVPRDPSDLDSIRGEHIVLQTIGQRLSSTSLSSTIPRSIFFSESPGLMLQTFLRGEPLHLHISSRRGEHLAQWILEWLKRFHVEIGLSQVPFADSLNLKIVEAAKIIQLSRTGRSPLELERAIEGTRAKIASLVSDSATSRS